MTRSELVVEKMDCAAEERLVRLALEGREGVGRLAFDLPARRLIVWHEGEADAILARLEDLRLGARLLRSTADDGAVPGAAAPAPGEAAAAAGESRTLRLLLGINAAMFVVEVVAGWLAQSTGLLADSLDMFADAAIYGLALFAVGRAPSLKRRAAHASGGLQLALALGALAEVARRALAGSAPEPPAMIGVAGLALAANVACLMLVARYREAGVHMKASFIFSANDVIANLGVMAAGGLVAATGSRLPDLVAGGAIAVVVLAGAVRILRLR
jgi:Co/Zn/Cd efflux system component